MGDVQIPAAIRLQILADKLQMWRNTLYDATLDAKVAQVLKDQPALLRAAGRMKKALGAIEFLEKLLQEEEEEVPNDPGTDSI